MDESVQSGKPIAGLAWQVAATFVVALLPMNAGMAQGWMSPMVLVLTSDDSPVGKFSENDVSSMAAIPPLMILLLAFAVGSLANKIGRKKTLIILGIGSTISGAILTFPKTKLWVYAGLVTSAFPLLGVLMSLMFVTETVQVPIRGFLVSTCSVLMNVGTLISYILGYKLSYVAYNATFIEVPALFTILMLWIPESPYYHIEKSQVEDAIKSLMWLRGGNNEVVEREIEVLTSAKSEREESVSFTQILKKKEFRRALVLSITAYALQMLSGIPSILSYSSLIFKTTGSPFSIQDSSIIIAILVAAASVVNSILIDKLGRKPLLYISFIGGSLSMGVLATFLYSGTVGADLSEYEWVSLASIGIFVIVYGVGLAGVPGVLMNELSPTNIRATVGVVTMVIAVSIITVSLRSFSFLTENIGLYIVFAISAVSNFMGIFYTMFMVVETKGKSLELIAEELKR